MRYTDKFVTIPIVDSKYGRYSYIKLRFVYDVSISKWVCMMDEEMMLDLKTMGFMLSGLLTVDETKY